MATGRILLGREATFSDRSYTWLTAEAVEIDEVDGYDVARRRVLLDEVLLVTLHRKRRFTLLALCGVAAAIFGVPMVALTPRGNTGAFFLLFGLFCAPFALGFVVHLLFGTDYVTLFGKRSRARLAFNFRKARAREVYALLVREVQAVQELSAPPQPSAPAVEEAPAVQAPAVPYA